MKKLFLLGAIVASMAFSSSALAAVTYNETGSLDVTYDTTAKTVSVATDLSTYAGQMTVVVVDGNADATTDNIIYIDQSAAGAGIFQAMPVKGDLDAGLYTIKVGNASALLRKTFAVDGTTATLVSDTETGMIWKVTLNKAVFANGLDSFVAKFVTATEDTSFDVDNIADLNTALAGFAGTGNFEFYVGVETTKDITGADFTANVTDTAAGYGVSDKASWTVE